MSAARAHARLRAARAAHERRPGSFTLHELELAELAYVRAAAANSSLKIGPKC